DRVVYRRRGAHVYTLNSTVDHFHVRGKWNNFGGDFTNAVNRHGILRTQNCVRKASRGVDFKRKVPSRAQASVDLQGNRQRQLGFLTEDRNLLGMPVFEKLEITLRQITYRSAPLVGHR